MSGERREDLYEELLKESVFFKKSLKAIQFGVLGDAFTYCLSENQMRPKKNPRFQMALIPSVMFLKS